MESLSHLLPFDPSQLVVQVHEANIGKLDHVDPTSGRRYKVGVEWELDAVYNTRAYYFYSLRFSLP